MYRILYHILHYCSFQAQIYEDEKDFIRKEINKQTDLSEKDVRHQPQLAIPYNPCSYLKSPTHHLTLKTMLPKSLEFDSFEKK